MAVCRVECGGLEKKNYVPLTGHNYETVSIREATCTQGGLTLHLCKSCGDFYTETTPIGSHHYHTKNVNPNCQSVGYTEHKCEVCGDTYITDIQPLVSHAFDTPLNVLQKPRLARIKVIQLPLVRFVV